MCAVLLPSRRIAQQAALCPPWRRGPTCCPHRRFTGLQAVLTLLGEHEQGRASYDGSLAVAVLEPLYLAAGSTNPKIVDAALGCLHKLVSATGTDSCTCRNICASSCTLPK